MGLPLEPPVKPMLARAAKRIPSSGDLLFEPKWDGFRCLVFRDGDTITLQSRSGKSLNRYFPEVCAQLLESLPPRIVLDGELVVAMNGRLEFDALTERVHPADSRVQLLAEQNPARYVAFDLLAYDDILCTEHPTDQRRAGLVSLLDDTPGVHLTPATDNPDTARHWFTLFEGAGLDGVIGKPMNDLYLPGKRALFKYKHGRTADCVLGGLRWHTDSEPGTSVGSLLLGLHDERGVLHHVGVVGAFTAERRRELAAELAPLITDEPHPWLGDHAQDGRRIPGALTRWRTGELPWVPLRPDHVLEVSYEHTEGAHPSRFRHTAQFVRWRPDRAPESCTYAQLDEPARYDLDAVLNGEVSPAG